MSKAKTLALWVIEESWGNDGGAVQETAERGWVAAGDAEDIHREIERRGWTNEIHASEVERALVAECQRLRS